MNLKDLLVQMEMEQGKPIDKPTIPKVDPMEEVASFSDYQAIKEVANRVTSLIIGGPINLRYSSTVQEVREALLLLRGPMVGVVQ